MNKNLRQLRFPFGLSIRLGALLSISAIAAMAQYAYTVFDAPNVIGISGFTGTSPSVINNLGDIAGTFINASQEQQGFIRAANGTFTVFDLGCLNKLQCGGAVSGINDLGQVAGYYINNPGAGPCPVNFIRDQYGQFSTALSKAGSCFRIIGLTNQGEYLLQGGPTTGNAYFQTAGGSLVPLFSSSLGLGNAVRAIYTALSNNGQAAYNIQPNPFFYVQGRGEIVTIFPPGGVGDLFYGDPTAVSGLSDNGSAIGTTFLNGMYPIFIHGPSGPSTYFIYPTDFPEALEQNSYPTPAGINTAGTIIGQFYDPNGLAHGFIGTPTPSCQLTSVINGPPKQLVITMRDFGSGLQSIQLTTSANSTVNIPLFAPGVTDPVTVTATKIDQSQSSEVTFQVTNSTGKTTSCDPVDFTTKLEGRPETQVFRSLNSAEHYVRVVNGTPGLRRMAFQVNGTQFPASQLANGETRVLDISSAMHAGSDNVVVLEAFGARGASAFILIGDNSVR